MSEVFFAGDLHFGHKNIHKLRKNMFCSNEEEHREKIIDNINSEVGKRDVLWLMGDICFKEALLPQLGRLKGQKFLILGNHDIDGRLFAPYVQKIVGLTSYKGFWLSHCPIHEEELRGKPNIHGHVHFATLKDRRYFNTSLENNYYFPINFDTIKEEVEYEDHWGIRYVKA